MFDDQVAAKRLSTVLGRLRADLGATQADAARVAGIDQSRVSRMEKGEVSNPADAQRLLDGLASLGSANAAAFKAFLGRTWCHTEPPSFWNPQREVLEKAEDALSAIETFLADAGRPWPLRRAIERHKATLQGGAAFLGNLAHNIAFIGDIGVGKSTAVSFEFGLLLPPTAGIKPMERPVLETGAGGTTICEVHIRRGPGHGICVQPMPEGELRALVADFCASKWVSLKDNHKGLGDALAVSRENERAIRNMAKLTRKKPRLSDKGPARDPMEELVRACASEDELRVRVLELMRLGERTRRDLWHGPAAPGSAMEWLAKNFRDVNNGRLPDVPLPKSIDLILPDFGKEFGELDVTVIDTKGVDDVAVREDLDLRLRDPRTVVAFCCKFNDAPGVSSKTLLGHMRQTFPEQLAPGKACVMALPRPDEARAMKDDGGEAAENDEEGYALKAAQVESDLGAGGFGTVPVLFFNAQADEADATRTAMHALLMQLRQSAADRLSELCGAVDEILEHHEAQAMALAVEEAARQLRTFLEANHALGARERLAHIEALTTVRNVRHASTLWAATRRNGDYPSLNVLHHVGVGAQRDAATRSARWFASFEDTLKAMKKDKGLRVASRTIDQIGKDAMASRAAFLEAVGRAGAEVYHEPLVHAPIWPDCAAEWGKGPGFTARVAQVLGTWFDGRNDLKDKLEVTTTGLWTATVLVPLQRLVNEAAPAPDKGPAPNVVKFRKQG